MYDDLTCFTVPTTGDFAAIGVVPAVPVSRFWSKEWIDCEHKKLSDMAQPFFCDKRCKLMCVCFPGAKELSNAFAQYFGVCDRGFSAGVCVVDLSDNAGDVSVETTCGRIS